MKKYWTLEEEAHLLILGIDEFMKTTDRSRNSVYSKYRRLTTPADADVATKNDEDVDSSIKVNIFVRIFRWIRGER